MSATAAIISQPATVSGWRDFDVRVTHPRGIPGFIRASIHPDDRAVTVSYPGGMESIVIQSEHLGDFSALLDAVKAAL